MKRTALCTARRCAGIVFSLSLLTGCGAWQTVKDSTAGTTHALFATKVKTMHLVIKADAELNPDDHGASLPVALRIYQLKDAKAFEASRYAQWLNASDDAPTGMISRSDVTLAPGATVTLHKPMDSNTAYVGIVALFRHTTRDTWRVVIPVSQWKKADPVTLRASGYEIQLSQ